MSRGESLGVAYEAHGEKMEVRGNYGENHKAHVESVVAQGNHVENPVVGHKVICVLAQEAHEGNQKVGHAVVAHEVNQGSDYELNHAVNHVGLAHVMAHKVAHQAQSGEGYGPVIMGREDWAPVGADHETTRVLNHAGFVPEVGHGEIVDHAMAHEVVHRAQNGVDYGPVIAGPVAGRKGWVLVVRDHEMTRVLNHVGLVLLITGHVLGREG